MAEIAHDDRNKAWICVAKLGAAHGVRGAIKLQSFTASPASIFDFDTVTNGPDGAIVALKRGQGDGPHFVVTVAGVTSREAAQALTGALLYVPRESLADDLDGDEFYLSDLAGLAAQDMSGQAIGHVRGVENFGAEDLLEIVLTEPVKGLGRHVFLPFRESLVPVVDIKGGFVCVDMAAWQDSQLAGEPEKGTPASLDKDGV